jgi:hypothetical protein
MNVMLMTVLIGVLLAGVGLTAALTSNRDAAARHKVERNKTNC